MELETQQATPLAVSVLLVREPKDMVILGTKVDVEDKTPATIEAKTKP